MLPKIRKPGKVASSRATSERRRREFASRFLSMLAYGIVTNADRKGRSPNGRERLRFTIVGNNSGVTYGTITYYRTNGEQAGKARAYVNRGCNVD
jgi:hypothetical protein